MSKKKHFDLEVVTRDGGKCQGTGCGEYRDTLYVLSRDLDTGNVSRVGCFVCVVKKDRDTRIEKRIIENMNNIDHFLEIVKNKNKDALEDNAEKVEIDV